MPQIPLGEGEEGDWGAQGGNCLGSVRTKGQVPGMVYVVVSRAAARRGDIS